MSDLPYLREKITGDRKGFINQEAITILNVYAALSF